MIGRIIVDGFKFTLSLKRMLPYILINFLLFYTISDMFGRIVPMELTEEAIKSIIPFFSIYFFVFLVYAISQLFLISVIIHQAKNYKKKISMKKSFNFSLSVFLKSFLIAVVLFAIFSLLGFIPFLWPIAIFFFFLASLYIYPAAILDDKRITESFKKSFSIFSKYPLQTLVVFLFLLLFSTIILLISFFPLILWLAGKMYNLYIVTQDKAMLINQFAKLLLSPTIIPFLLIPSFAQAFVSVMKIYVITRLYLALKKKA